MREAHEIDGEEEGRVPDVLDEEPPEKVVSVFLAAEEDDGDGAVQPEKGELPVWVGRKVGG